MRKTKTNALVIGRLLLALVLLVIRWLIFEPLYFFGVVISTIGETGLNGLYWALNTIQKANNELLTENKQRNRG